MNTLPDIDNDLHGDALPPPGLYDRILREIDDATNDE